MNNPNGLAVDTQARVWVAESRQFAAPRFALVGRWQAAAGVLRPDRIRRRRHARSARSDAVLLQRAGIQARLGQGDRRVGAGLLSPRRHAARSRNGAFWPDTPLYPPQQPERQYFTSCYTHSPIDGDRSRSFGCIEDGLARLVAGLGDAQRWPALRGEEFPPLWPAGTKPEAQYPKPEESATFAWTDANGDELPQPDEVKFIRQGCRAA